METMNYYVALKLALISSPYICEIGSPLEIYTNERARYYGISSTPLIIPNYPLPFPILLVQ